MKTLRNTLIFLAFAALPAAGGIAYAATATSTASSTPVIAGLSDCTITPADTAAISAAAAQGLAPELVARRTLLTRVIACAQADAQTLRTNLQSITVSGDEQGLQSQLSSKLNDALDFYTIELGKVNDAGIAETRVIAGEVLSWRTESYDPLSGEVNNFILWAGNQNLFTTANTRLTQTGSLVSFLEEAGPQTDLQNAYVSAQTLIQNAEAENADAKSALFQFLPPDQSLILIQESLQSLSDAYQKFTDISTTVQTLLPTSNQ